jgi:hypothetical protein
VAGGGGGGTNNSGATGGSGGYPNGGNGAGGAGAPGLGGTFSGIPLGGNGSIDGIGGNGVTKTGSGGGSGVFGGGTGGSGRVFITYPVFRILPLDYLYFNAKYNSTNREGNLTWAVTKEWENSHFEIERAVDKPTSWTKVGEVTGKGYSSSKVDYAYTEKELPARGGTIFYRLKQVNFNGSFFYTDIKAIQVDPVISSSEWVVYPNPTSGVGFKLELISDDQLLEGDVTASISSVLGQIEYFNDPDISRLSSRIGTYLQTKAAGVYILTLNWAGKTESFRIIKR